MAAKPTIYLDNSATTNIRAEVLEAMMPYLTNFWGNASSIHSAGQQARAAVEQAREQAAELIGAQPCEIVFTPNATYSNNVAILGRARFAEQHGLGRHIITSPIEHSSALEPVKYLKTRGWRVTMLGVDQNGLLNVDQLREAICKETSIISVMWASNEVGSIQPIRLIADLATEQGIFFHTDAVQVAGKIRIDVSDLNVHSLSLSGHKFHAPKGIGIHFRRKGSGISPVSFGGGQEGGYAPGTENVANIVAIGKAAELAAAELVENSTYLRHLSGIFLDRILELPKVKLTGPRDLLHRIPGHVSLVVTGKIGRDLVQQADREGLCIASTAACSSGASKISHVLRALALADEDAAGSLRISASKFTHEHECIAAVDILSRLITGCPDRLIA